MREFSFEQVQLHDEHIGAQYFESVNGFSTHRHNFVELIYIRDGAGVQEINGVPYEVKRGDFLFVNYEQTHGVFPDGSMTYYEVMFDLEFISRELINKNFSEDISLEDLAERSFYNPSYFSRIFKERFGMGFKTYVIKLRTDKAAALLKTTNMPIKDIIVNCGFNDKNAFYRALEKWYNTTPSKLREQHVIEE